MNPPSTKHSARTKWDLQAFDRITANSTDTLPETVEGAFAEFLGQRLRTPVGVTGRSRKYVIANSQQQAVQDVGVTWLKACVSVLRAGEHPHRDNLLALISLLSSEAPEQSARLSGRLNKIYLWRSEPLSKDTSMEQWVRLRESFTQPGAYLLEELNPHLSLAGWLRKLAQSPESEPSTRDLADLMQNIEGLIRHEKFIELNKAIQMLDVKAFHPTVFVAFLRITFPFRSKLEHWTRLLEVSEKELTSRGINAGSVLRGLK